uniref:Core-2/I-branching beta-1,6-N-acetylglucosaminyltransferase family protein n=1 Tax=Davidia involucrata TaxID=16924 RepID=A0A5B7BI70_DAVIN
MKTARAWRLRVRDMLITSGSRQRPHLRRPIWIIVLVCLVTIFLIGAYIYPPGSSAACYIFSSSGCTVHEQLPPVPSRELTDEETASQVVIREILKTTPIQSKNPKIAFMFLTPGPLPFEKLWDIFFHGHEDRFSVYVHSSKETPVHVSRYFSGRDIRSEKVVWGKISMVDAERRLLANALKDPDNQQFVLLSDSCIPVHNFDFVYNYLMFTNVSFIDCFVDPGPHGGGRYSEHMLPEVESKDFRKGSQWFTMKRQHAIIVMADSLYYTKFRLYCKPNMDGRNCYADEHYLPTFFHMIDPAGIASWSVTYVDWSEGKWHPRSYRAQDVTYELFKNITSIDYSLHVTSDDKREVLIKPCMWNGMQRPCHLFARKFYPEALDKLIHIFSNYTTF